MSQSSARQCRHLHLLISQFNRIWYGQATPHSIRDSKIHTCTDRPVHTVVFSLAVAGFLLLSISRAWPRLFRSPGDGAGYVEIPLDHREETGTHREIPSDGGAHIFGPGPRIPRLLLIASICALTVRIELFRRIYKATECTINSVEVIHMSQSDRRVYLAYK